jgi:competence protein ComFC
MLRFNPQKISGNWDQGFALDIHTVSSTFVGYNEQGKEQFETTRSDIGEAVYQIKYKANKDVLLELLETVAEVAENKWKIIEKVDVIVPVPPSNRSRTIKLPTEMAKHLSVKYGKIFHPFLLSKIKATEELKGVFGFEKRKELLANAFQASPSLENKSVLVVDDLYRSGATLQSVTGALKKDGKAKKVYVLTLTKTRSLT